MPVSAIHGVVDEPLGPSRRRPRRRRPRPRADGPVGGDDQAGALVAAGDKVDEQVGLFGFEGDAPDLADDQQRVTPEPDQLVLDTAGEPPRDVRRLWSRSTLTDPAPWSRRSGQRTNGTTLASGRSRPRRLTKACRRRPPRRRPRRAPLRPQRLGRIGHSTHHCGLRPLAVMPMIRNTAVALTAGFGRLGSSRADPGSAG